jgi:hypothetical protein
MRVKEIDIDKLLEYPKEKRAYMAGFFDGEGHISIARRGMIHTSRDHSTPMRHVYALVAGAAQNKQAPLLLFYELFGGTLRIDTRAHKGRHSKQVIYEWNIGGNLQVPTLLKWLRPYLLVKLEQAAIAIEFAASDPNNMSEEMFLQFQKRMTDTRSNDAETEYRKETA